MASNIVLSGTKGISLPSFTTTEKNAIVSPATGAVVYDTTLNQESVYNGSAWVNVNTSGNSTVTAGTAVASTSGTSIDFTSIPSWVKRITVMLNGVSTNGTAYPRIQIGAGSVETSGYTGSSGFSTSGAATITLSSGLDIYSNGAANIIYGQAVFTLVGSNVWVFTFNGGASNIGWCLYAGGGKTTSGTLDRVRITTVNGTDTFDAGSINILYE